MSFEEMLAERDKYNHLMIVVMNGGLHLKQKGETVTYPISDVQKKKDYFLYKYFEYQYNKIETLINNSIYRKSYE